MAIVGQRGGPKKRRFTGAFTNRVDSKGRVSIPSDYRAALDGDRDNPRMVYIRANTENGSLEGFAEAYVDEMAEAMERLPFNSQSRRALEDYYLGDLRHLPLDKEGRVNLPNEFIDHAGLTDEGKFVGLNKTFEIWNPARYAQVQKTRHEMVTGTDLQDLLQTDVRK